MSSKQYLAKARCYTQINKVVVSYKKSLRNLIVLGTVEEFCQLVVLLVSYLQMQKLLTHIALNDMDRIRRIHSQPTKADILQLKGQEIHMASNNE